VIWHVCLSARDRTLCPKLLDDFELNLSHKIPATSLEGVALSICFSWTRAIFGAPRPLVLCAFVGQWITSALKVENLTRFRCRHRGTSCHDLAWMSNSGYSTRTSSYPMLSLHHVTVGRSAKRPMTPTDMRHISRSRICFIGTHLGTYPPPICDEITDTLTALMNFLTRMQTFISKSGWHLFTHGKWTYSHTRSRSLVLATDYAPQITMPHFCGARGTALGFVSEGSTVCMSRATTRCDR
jgi:hypothetical protein